MVSRRKRVPVTDKTDKTQVDNTNIIRPTAVLEEYIIDDKGFPTHRIINNQPIPIDATKILEKFPTIRNSPDLINPNRKINPETPGQPIISENRLSVQPPTTSTTILPFATTGDTNPLTVSRPPSPPSSAPITTETNTISQQNPTPTIKNVPLSSPLPPETTANNENLSGTDQPPSSHPTSVITPTTETVVPPIPPVPIHTERILTSNPPVSIHTETVPPLNLPAPVHTESILTSIPPAPIHTESILTSIPPVPIQTETILTSNPPAPTHVEFSRTIHPWPITQPPDSPPTPPLPNQISEIISEVNQPHPGSHRMETVESWVTNRPAPFAFLPQSTQPPTQPPVSEEVETRNMGPTGTQIPPVIPSQFRQYSNILELVPGAIFKRNEETIQQVYYDPQQSAFISENRA